MKWQVTFIGWDSIPLPFFNLSLQRPSYCHTLHFIRIKIPFVGNTKINLPLLWFIFFWCMARLFDYFIRTIIRLKCRYSLHFTTMCSKFLLGLQTLRWKNIAIHRIFFQIFSCRYKSDTDTRSSCSRLAGSAPQLLRTRSFCNSTAPASVEATAGARLTDAPPAGQRSCVPR